MADEVRARHRREKQIDVTNGLLARLKRYHPEGGPRLDSTRLRGARDETRVPTASKRGAALCKLPAYREGSLGMWYRMGEYPL
jgi:hypothetical protein